MNDTTTPEARLAAIQAKLAIIQSGEAAIMPSGEIVPRGTPGSRNYDPPKPVFQAENRFWQLHGHPGPDWSPCEVHQYNAEKAAFVLGWHAAQTAAPPGLIPPCDSPPEPAMRWIARDEHPETPGWYYVKRLDGTIGNRFFDDANGGIWLHCNAVNGFTQNHHFADWLHIPMIHTPYPKPATEVEAMHARSISLDMLRAAYKRAKADESEDGIRAAAIFLKEIQRRRGPRPKQPEPADSPTLTDIALKIQGAIATMRNRPTMTEQAKARRQLDLAVADLNKLTEGDRP